MINRAIARITDEMMKIDDPLAQMLEEHLTEVCTNEQTAEKLLDPGKTLKELHEKVWNEAKNRRKGNGAYIPDKEILQMAEDYYGIQQKAAPAKRINALDLL